MSNVKRYLLAVGLVAFVAFLVGCGGDSDNATNPTPVPPSVDEEQATPTPKADADDTRESATEPGAVAGDWG